MTGLADKLLLNSAPRQPFIRSECEDRNYERLASVIVASLKLDISPFGFVVILCLGKLEWHVIPPPWQPFGTKGCHATLLTARPPPKP
jgi:hypothetical protein